MSITTAAPSASIEDDALGLLKALENVITLVLRLGDLKMQLRTRRIGKDTATVQFEHQRAAAFAIALTGRAEIKDSLICIHYLSQGPSPNTCQLSPTYGGNHVSETRSQRMSEQSVGAEMFGIPIESSQFEPFIAHQAK